MRTVSDTYMTLITTGVPNSCSKQWDKDHTLVAVGMGPALVSSLIDEVSE